LSWEDNIWSEEMLQNEDLDKQIITLQQLVIHPVYAGLNKTRELVLPDLLAYLLPLTFNL
jgi:hypothetical protein